MGEQYYQLPLKEDYIFAKEKALQLEIVEFHLGDRYKDAAISEINRILSRRIL